MILIWFLFGRPCFFLLVCFLASWQASVALTGALTQLISPLALNKITDYMDTYDSEKENNGIPLVVVVSVAGLFLGQVTPSPLNSPTPTPPPRS